MSEVASARPAGKRPGHVPGEEGVWVFIGGDFLVFAVFFITFAVDRRGALDLFEQSRQLLDRQLGLLNTLLLLSSSWFIAQAVGMARARDPRAKPFVLGAMALGIGFVIVKIFEYQAKIAMGLTLNSNAFFVYYYMFTGIHLVHVLIGLGVLGYTVTRFDSSGQLPGGVALIEGGGAFWHLVDLLWIVLFALLYLL